MRLNNLSDDIIFDELEETTDPNKKYFISSLLVIPTLITPKKDFCGKIYTSRKLWKLMLIYYRQYAAKLSTNNIIKLESNVPMKLQINDGKGERCIEVLMIEAEDINRNVMFMFRMDSKTTHLYAGACTELRRLLFNTVFTEWIQNGVTHMYVDISRASRTDERDPRELNNTIDAIENILNTKTDYKVILNIPKLGYETLVYYLSERLRARVLVGGMMSIVFQILQKNAYFQSNYLDARIVIVHKSFTLDEIKDSYKEQKYIFFKITDKTREGHDGFYELGWSPLPSAFELQILASIIHPDRIYAIHHNNEACVAPKVPHYLLKLCKNYEEICGDLEEIKNVELKMMEDILSVTSTVQNSPEVEENGNIQRTPAISSCEDAQKMVHQWLDNNQADGFNIAKSLHKVKNSKDDATTSRKSVLFRVQRRSIKYLEDYDSS